MKLFDLNSPLMRGLAKVWDLIALNFLFMLCCLPVVTIGASVTALFSVELKLVRNEEGSIVKAFFQAFASNFKKSTAVHLLFLIIAFILLADFLFVFYSVADQGPVTYLLLGASGFLALITAMTMQYIYPLLAMFENSVSHTIQTALVLSVRHLPITLALMVLSFAPVLIMLIPNENVIGFAYLMLLIGFSSLALLQSYFLRKVFDQNTPQTGDNSSQEVHI